MFVAQFDAARRGRKSWLTVLLALPLLLVSAVIHSAGPVVISEFQASNGGGLADEDGDHPDWIELHNPGATTVSLDGWFLTDSESNLSKWRLPATNLPPGRFLIVFASGKNRAIAGAPLHANFSLDANGEYLGLIQPDGLAVASEFAPQFPEQLTGVSYGVAQNVVTTLLVSNTSPARVLVPMTDPGRAWISNGYNHSLWIAGSNGVGYQAHTPGFSVRLVRANTGVCDLNTAETVLATPSMQAAVFTAQPAMINHLNTGSGGNFTGDFTFPGLTVNVDVEHFAVEATGIITIPTAGQWTFGVNSDDGFSVTLGTNRFSHPSPRGASDTLATFTLTAGEHPVRLVFYECTGGSSLEFFAKAAAAPAYRLVGHTAAGGLAVKSLPGSGTAASFRPIIATDVQSNMYNRAGSALIRLPFTVTDPAAFTALTLRMRYDDGFVAYLNGVELVRQNSPATPLWNSRAPVNRSNALALTFEDFNVPLVPGRLVTGANVLALHGLNDATNSSEFLQAAELGEYRIVGTTNHYFATPTPGTANASATFAFVDNLKFTPGRGWCSNSVTVEITTITPGATIRYTVDGTPPTATTGTVYSGPFRLTNTTTLRAIGYRPGFEPTTLETHTYLFLDQVIRQTGAGFPTNWNGVTPEYSLSPAIVDNPQWAPTIVNDLKAIPTLSLVMKTDDLFGPSGIYVNTGAQGVAWERPGSLEYFRPDGREGFHINCGVRIQGGVSRSAMRKHGLRVLFKNIYGSGKLDYDLFPGSPVREFDTLVMKGSFNDHWGWSGAPAVMHRDQWCRDTQNDLGGFAPHGTYVHLYLNGLYWGLYNLGEKGDASFAAQHLGGEREDYDAFNSDENIDGDAAAWNQMFAIASAGITNDTSYTSLRQYLNVPNFIDYLLMNFHAANTDWPGHNWNAARRREPGAGFHFFSWDAEWTMFIGSGVTTDRTGLTDGSPGRLYAALRTHPEFRREFGDRAQQHLFNNGALTPANATARWVRRAEEIDRAIVPETARWGYGHTRNTWLAEEARVRSSWFPTRTEILVTQLRNAGLYPQLAAPRFSPYGGLVAPGYSLTLSNPNPAGSIWYTTDGSDPRLWGGAVAPTARTYSSPLVLTNATTVRARVLDGTTWSALTTPTFYVAQDFTALALTEIMYRPAPWGIWSGDDLEFVELKNTGATTLDLSGLVFSGGLDFTATNGTRLPPGAFFVLVRNPIAFAARYPGVPVGGTYSNRLDNGGERLAYGHLLAPDAVSVTYNNSPPWPLTPDGMGFSLVRRSLAGAASEPIAWRASAARGGSPGADDPDPGIPGIVINEVLTHTTPPDLDAIELHNPTASPVTIGGWFLSDDARVPRKFRIPTATVVPAGGHWAILESAFNATPGVAPSFALNSRGESLHLFSGDAATNLTGYSHSIEFGTSAPGESFGRLVLSTGETDWPAQLTPTLGTNNSGPRIGPVVINEILYHPAAGHDEFVELYNASASPVSLFDINRPTNTWRLAGLDYSFPSTTVIPARGFLVVAGTDPAAFRQRYGVSLTVPVLGPFAGVLQDSGERLQLERPESPDSNGVPYVVVDEVRYNDKFPWPPGADGDGPSLQRRAPDLYANEPLNWFASGITPGTSNSLNLPPAVAIVSPTNGTVYGAPASVELTASAVDPDGSIVQLEYLVGGIVIGSAALPPFSATWTSAPVGTHVVTARARDNRLAVSVSTPVTITITPPPIGNGVGLRGDYFDNANFTGTRIRRLDPTVNFDWGNGSPDPAMGADSFSVRWTGSVQPRFTETYTLTTVSDDGVRLWVNNQLLVDNWTDHAPTENSGIITLQAAQLYDLRMEMYESGGGATAQLLWSSPTVTREIIPTTQLYPPVTSNLPPVVTLTSPTGGVFVSSANITLTASAADPDGAITRVAFVAGTNQVGTVLAAPYQLVWSNVPPGAPVLTAIATDDSGISRTSAPVSILVVAGFTTNFTLVATGSVWRYRDTGPIANNTWVTADYNDSGWSNGPAQLGYGDGDERTLVGFGPNAGAKHITTYFRRQFVLADIDGITALNLRLLRDDAALVHLNGAEVRRDNLPAGAISSSTLGLASVSGTGESTYFPSSVAPGYLISGTNVLAVEIHQSSGNSIDLSFDLELHATVSIVAPYIVVQPASRSVQLGQTAVFNVGAEGSSPLSYQWRRNGTNLPGANRPALTLDGVPVAAAGAYSVVITNRAGSVTSVVATLTVINPDTDGDGLPDWWELAHGTRPDIADAGSDLDRDGMSNRDEYFAGTQPNNAASHLYVVPLRSSPGAARIEFSAVSNRAYRLHFKDSLNAPFWTQLMELGARPSNRVERLADPGPIPGVRFYRLSVPTGP